MVQLQHDLTLTLQALAPSGLVLSPEQQVGGPWVPHAVVLAQSRGALRQQALCRPRWRCRCR